MKGGYLPPLAGALLLLAIGRANTGHMLWASIDAFHINYVLEHCCRAIFDARYPFGLTSPPYFYPAQNGLALSENVLGAAPLYWLYRALAPSHQAYELWLVTLPMLTFASCAAASLLQGAGPLLALWAAYLFAYGLPRVMHTHAVGPMQPEFFAPLAVYCCWRFLQAPTVPWLACTLGLAWLQVLAGLCLGWFNLLGLLAFGVVACLADAGTRQRAITFLRARWRPVGLLGLGWIALNLAVLQPYLQVKTMSQGFSEYEVNLLQPRWTSWLTAPAESVVWHRLAALSEGLPDEHSLFMGITFFAVSLAAIVHLAAARDFRNSSAGRFSMSCMVVAGLLVLMTLRWPNDLSAWSLVRHVLPGAGSMRGIERVWCVVYLYGLMGAAVGAHAWASETLRSPLLRVALGCVILAAGVGEQQVCPLARFDWIVERRAAMLRPLLAGCDTAYLEFQSPDTMAAEQWRVSQLAMMWAGLEDAVPVVNGYSSYWPANYQRFWRPMTAPQVSQWLSSLPSCKMRLLYPQRSDPQDDLPRLYGEARQVSADGLWVAYTYRLPLQRRFGSRIETAVASPVQSGQALSCRLSLRNEGTFVWWRDGRFAVRVGAAWQGQKQPPVEVALPRDVAPGESVELTLTTVPPAAGRASFEVALRQADVPREFSQAEGALRVPVEVHP